MAPIAAASSRGAPKMVLSLLYICGIVITLVVVVTDDVYVAVPESQGLSWKIPLIVLVHTAAAISKDLCTSGLEFAEVASPLCLILRLVLSALKPGVNPVVWPQHACSNF